MFYMFSMTTRVIICIETLGFEVFGSKIPFLHVLDCHNSPQRADSSLVELDHQNWGFSRLELATASKVTRLASKVTRLASRQCGSTLVARFRQALAFFKRISLYNLFIEVNPSNQGPK
jgi:hypothetical protein